MREIILNLAISLDGYIADESGKFEWIVGHGDSSLNSEEQFDFSKFVDSLDTIVMGSGAYEDTPDESIKSFSDKKLIIASSKKFEIPANAEIVNGDVCGRVLEIREEKGKDIWLFGGGIAIDPFIKANVIDKYIVGIIPTILGSGKRLFLDNNPTTLLHLEKTYIADGILILVYRKR